MKKMIFAAGSVLALIAFLAACNSSTSAPGSAVDNDYNEKPAVVATFYPLAEFSRQVGGDLISVSTIVPSGTEPHDFEPTPRDIARASDAKLFIYNGGLLDQWAAKVADQLPEGVEVINMKDSLGLESDDPHFWLDPVMAAKEVETIRDALSAADPSHKDTYEANAAEYVAGLKKLDAVFAAGLSSCAKKEIFTSHAAFSYLAARYDLTQVAIAGLSPEEEPSARDLAELVRNAKENGIKYIFFETLASPKLAETLANEVGAQTLVLNPLEGLTEEETNAGLDYISVMEENLSSLKQALECK